MNVQFALQGDTLYVLEVNPRAARTVPFVAKATGVPFAKILAPGNPAVSMLSLRPKTLGAGRMPPLASQVIDAEGTAAIDAWISSLSSCPSPTNP